MAIVWNLNGAHKLQFQLQKQLQCLTETCEYFVVAIILGTA